jgi:hypothetical protein
MSFNPSGTTAAHLASGLTSVSNAAHPDPGALGAALETSQLEPTGLARQATAAPVSVQGQPKPDLGSIEVSSGRLQILVSDKLAAAVCQSRCAVCQSRCTVCQSRCRAQLEATLALQVQQLQQVDQIQQIQQLQNMP